jgi:sugar/nucleoside kinase (ribokinase family)
VAEAYSLAIVPPELLSDDDVPDQLREKARRWAYDARFAVTPHAGPSFDYEVVVGQSVKNLRHLERRTLADELDKGKLKQIGAAVWHNGLKQPNRDAFLVAARKLKAKAKKQLIVIQPRISKTERDYCWSNNAAEQRAKRIKQVETLMLAARASPQRDGRVQPNVDH